MSFKLKFKINAQDRKIINSRSDMKQSVVYIKAETLKQTALIYQVQRLLEFG